MLHFVLLRTGQTLALEPPLLLGPRPEAAEGKPAFTPKVNAGETDLPGETLATGEGPREAPREIVNLDDMAERWGDQ